MKAEMLGVKCITNLHIGTSGSVYGDIKSEVEKDAILGTPLIPSSGIKGALRNFWQINRKEDVMDIFGSDVEEKAENKKGNCKFISGQLLFRPMRVSRGSYAYCLVTTPELIEIMMNTVGSFQIDLNDIYETSVEDLRKEFYEIKKALNEFQDEVTAGIVNTEKCSIEEVEGYKIKKFKPENGLYKFLSKISADIPVVIMKTQFFQMIDLPIVARNYLKEGKSSNLWYEEFVPHQSYFYFVLLWEKKEINIFLNFIQEICKQPVAFGGNNSVGYGYCKITPMGEMKEKNNGK